MSATLELAIGLGAVFVAIVVLLTVVGVLTAERQQVGRSLAAIRALQSAGAGLRREIDRPFDERVLVPFMRRLTRLGRRVSMSGEAARISRRLDLAGNPARWDVDRVLAFKMLGLFVGGALGIGLPLAANVKTLLVIVIAVGGIVLGYFTPDLTLYQIGAKRSDRLRKEMPDALDLLTISVEAGLGFDAALAQVARNTTGPLAEEFFRVLQEMQIGMGRSQAFRALGERTDVAELRGFVAAMVQADAFGIPIADVLRVQAKEMRVKRSQRAEEQAQKVPVKILFPLIFCIMPALFIVIIGPAAINIIRHLLHH